MGDAEATQASRAVRLLIGGRVQGVGFREWMVGRAAMHGLAGFVRNRREGTVEALLIGLAPAVDALVAECRRGPRAAEVDTVTAGDGSNEAWPHPDFRRLPTV